MGAHTGGFKSHYLSPRRTLNHLGWSILSGLDHENYGGRAGVNNLTARPPPKIIPR